MRLTSPPRPSRLLWAWVALRLGVPALLLIVRPTFVGDLLARFLESADYAHGMVKLGLEAWMVVLFRLPALVLTSLALTIGAVVVGMLRGRAQHVAIAVLLVGASSAPLAPWWPAWIVLCALLALNLSSLPLPRWLAWIPGTELLLPRAVAGGLDLSPRLVRIIQVLAVPGLLGAWLLVDSVVVGDSRRGEVGHWPAERVDARARILEEAPPGVICEYHDVDLVNDRLVVVAEGSHRLLSFPLDFSAAPTAWVLPAPWWSIEGLVLDSESDPATGTTWFLNGPDRISALRWLNNRWVFDRSSAPLQHQEHHVYTRWLPERQELLVVSINASAGPGEGTVMRVPTPALGPIQQLPLRLDGKVAPTVRDIAWLPTLSRIVVAPNWGDRLYLLDPDTGAFTPWVEVPTMNGKMTWSPETQRLYLGQPNRMSVAVIDVDKGVIERSIPTQPGVRPVAIDGARGLMLTASVLTGEVWVQRLADGALVDRFGTFMPLVRELTLDTTKGNAYLSTWTALYALPYTGGTLPPAPPRAPPPYPAQNQPGPPDPAQKPPTPPPAAPR